MDDNLILRALMGAAGASVLAEIDLEKKRQEAEDLRKDRDAARAENETLRGAMAADDKRLRDAEKRVWSGGTWGCDAPDKMADEIVFLRQRLADSEHPPAMAQQRDEISYLQARLDEERSVSARLRQQLDAAQAAETLQRTRIEQLQAFVEKVRQRVTLMITISDVKFLHAALAELDAEGGA